MSRRATPSLERWLFVSRFLLAPFYVLMLLALAGLLVKFCQELLLFLPQILVMRDTDVILAILTLIDLTLVASLLIMVIFSGYESFVSRIDIPDRAERPDWMDKVDFSGLKLKLIASIVAISGIHLLKSFMAIGGESLTPDKQAQLMWLVIIHFVFVLSGLMLALMDRATAAALRDTRASLKREQPTDE